ncbi:unannotated protein [freshwater metagenome]|uniref:Unannotated protein n=1 Tax=freshwater metagenome TaxID=449393 RepID=A0A6J6TSM2_9ZZZZ
MANVIGQYGMESVLRFESNWAAKYAYQTNSKGIHSSGIFRYLGVPIFDGFQHLGIRLPNFSSNYTIHPMVFLSRYVATYTLTQLFVIMNLSILFYFIALTFKSWDLKYWKSATLFTSTALSGPIIILLVHLDWAATAATFCGVFGLTTVLVDKSLYVSNFSTSDLQRLLAKTIFVFSALITNHPVGFFVAIPMFVAITFRFVTLRPDPKHGLKIVSVFISMSIIAVICLIQILEKSFGEIRPPVGSLFDFFNYRASSPTNLIFYITAAVSVSALQPIFWLSELSPHITKLSDFFAWPLLAGSFLFSINKSTRLPKSLILFRRNMVLVFFGYLLSSILVGLVSQRNVFGVNVLIRGDGWEYAIAVFGVVVISSPILLLTSIQKSDQILGFKFWRQTPIISSLILLGFAVSILYPIVALVKGPSRVASSSYEQLKNSDGLSIVERAKLGENRRFVFLKSIAFEGTKGLSSLQRGWLPILGIPHPLVLSRNGFPTPAGSPHFQDPGTLSTTLGGDTEFYGSQCSPRLYDFLGIDTVIADFLDTGCIEEISRYFSSATESHHFQPEICYGLKTCSVSTRIGDKDFSGLSVTAIRPVGFHSFYLTKFVNDRNSVCALESSLCLDNLRSNPGLKFDGNPLKFCEHSCWVNYNYQVPQDAQFLVVPINFDSAITVMNKYTKQSFKVENIQGLVGVRLDQNNRSGTLEIDVVADTKMKMWVFATYLHTVLLAYLIFLLFRTRVEFSV